MGTADPLAEDGNEGRGAAQAGGREVMPSKDALEKAGHELKENPPRVLAKTRAKKGKKAANKQRVAIMFSKARRGK